MGNKIKVTGGFISNEKNPYERRTAEGLIIPAEFEEDIKREQERPRPLTPEGLIVPAEFIDPRKSPEEKQYLIFYTMIEDDRSITTWEVCIGRTETYRFVKTMVECIDFTNSFILVEGVALEDAVTLYDFTKHIKQYYDDSFDIDDYIDTDMSSPEEIEDIELSPDQELVNAVVGKPNNTNNNINIEAIDLYKTAMNAYGSVISNMTQNLMASNDEKEDDTKNI